MLTEKKISDYVENNVQVFHQRRLDSLMKLRLNNILKRKNPYLFRAKNIVTAPDLVKNLLDAFLSSQEEGIFGTFLEELAIFVCGEAYQGKKSSAEGIDLELEKDNVKYIVSIKSGPNWGNSGQIKRMVDNFRKAKKILRGSNSNLNVVAVNGCCYGKDNNPDKGDYHKLCGARFWSFISGNENLYIEIIKPLGHQAKARNDNFMKEYAKVINKFTLEFIKGFCDVEGNILWNKLVNYNSGAN